MVDHGVVDPMGRPMSVDAPILTRDERNARYLSLLGDLNALQQLTQDHHAAVDQRMSRIRGTILALHETHNLTAAATSLVNDVR